jgi:Na+/proline symporter/nitrogen-specific signal transduction histidine kinase
VTTGAAGSGVLSVAVVVVVSLLYVALLFVLAFWSDQRARSNRPGLLASPVVYTLSIAVYCTSWTFYGAVGSASRGGLEFLPIYLGPTIVFIGWWAVLRKLARISKVHRITSIADFISSRYGKSGRLAVAVTLVAVIGTTPYIALQLKAVASTFIAVTGTAESAETNWIFADTALWVAICMALFAIVFGTRKVGADEHHPGIVAAVAFESLVKLMALMSVGLLVVLLLGPGPDGVFARGAARSAELSYLWTFRDTFGARWTTVLFLAASAIVCLPRQFQVAIVEIENERHLATASWLFPLYLFLISLFVIPIALAGMTLLPDGSNPDLFVLTVPIASGHDWLALFAFIGGFSSATSMVIVASIALSIMLSNHVIMPVLFGLRAAQGAGGMLTSQILWVRRISIMVIFALALIYYRISTPGALAAIGLISFAGVAQFLPALIGGLYWRGATERGALAGLTAGFIVWAYTLLLPALIHAPALLSEGPWGIGFLRPQALFGAGGWDPLVHSLFWSYVANIGLYIGLSLVTRAEPLERLQGALFTDAFRQRPGGEAFAWQRTATAEDLRGLTERVLGRERSDRVFREFGSGRGAPVEDREADSALIAHVERNLAGSVGAASARVLISGIAKGESISLDQIIGILDETQQVIQYSQRLETQSRELERTATQLKAANEQLRRLDKQKDDFLSRVSHELRTPMTSIRAVSELLLAYDDIPDERRTRSIEIIAKESQRLTGLLDDILDLAGMVEGTVIFNLADVDAVLILDDAMHAVQGYAESRGVRLEARYDRTPANVRVDRGRLTQVLVNLLSNAIKFNDSAAPHVEVDLARQGRAIEILVSDNGPGIPGEDRARIFERFARSAGANTASVGGSGLGLAISMEIVQNLGGRLFLREKGVPGAFFVVELPVAAAARVEAPAGALSD